MAMGVSYDEYWNGDYTMLPYYRKAYALKRRAENEKLWLQGIYILRAIGSIIPSAKSPYPDEPFALTEEEVEEQEARRRQEEIDNARAYMETMMHNINKKRREEGAKDGRRSAADDLL